MSNVDIIADTTPAILLLRAILDKFGDDCDLGKVVNIAPGKSIVEVKLTVNGIEIPFEHTINEMWTNVNNDVDNRALDRAREIISGAGLSRLFEAIKRADYELEQALNNALKTIIEAEKTSR